MSKKTIDIMFKRKCIYIDTVHGFVFINVYLCVSYILSIHFSKCLLIFVQFQNLHRVWVYFIRTNRVQMSVFYKILYKIITFFKLILFDNNKVQNCMYPIKYIINNYVFSKTLERHVIINFEYYTNSCVSAI